MHSRLFSRLHHKVLHNDEVIFEYDYAANIGIVLLTICD